jgi:hypothetical protein
VPFFLWTAAARRRFGCAFLSLECGGSTPLWLCLSLECGGLTPLWLCLSFSPLLQQLSCKMRSGREKKAASSHRTPKRLEPPARRLLRKQLGQPNSAALRHRRSYYNGNPRWRSSSLQLPDVRFIHRTEPSGLLQRHQDRQRLPQMRLARSLVLHQPQSANATPQVALVVRPIRLGLRQTLSRSPTTSGRPRGPNPPGPARCTGRPPVVRHREVALVVRPIRLGLRQTLSDRQRLQVGLAGRIPLAQRAVQVAHPLYDTERSRW